MVWLVGVLLLPWLGGTAQARGAPQAHLQTEEGLHQALFVLPEGRVIVRFPDDLAVGDVVSGTLAVEPVGANPKKLDRNHQRLLQLHVRVGGFGGDVRPSHLGPLAVCEGASGGATLRCEPPDLAGPGISVRLESAKGQELAEVRIPVHPSPPAGAEGYRYRTIGLVGQSLEIQGAFDGSFSTTRVSVDGVTAPPLAESPRRLLVASPAAVVGPARLELAEAGRRYSGPFRNLAIFLRAGKPVLEANERTILEVQIHGLQDLGAELPLEIVSRTPEIVRLERGARQPLTVHPEEVQAGGVYQWFGPLLGVRPAGFSIAIGVAGTLPWRRLEPAAPESFDP